MLGGQPKLAPAPEFRRIASSHEYACTPDAFAVVAFAHRERDQRAPTAAVNVIGFGQTFEEAERLRATAGKRFSEVYITRAGAWFLVTPAREDSAEYIAAHWAGNSAQFVRLTSAAMTRNFMQAQINVEIAYRGSRDRACARRASALEEHGVTSLTHQDHGPLLAYAMPERAIAPRFGASRATYRAVAPTCAVVIVCAPLHEAPSVAFCAQFDTMRDAREYIFNTLMPVAAENTVAHAIPLQQWVLFSDFAGASDMRESARTEAHEVHLALQRGPSNGPPPDASHEMTDHIPAATASAAPAAPAAIAAT